MKNRLWAIDACGAGAVLALAAGVYLFGYEPLRAARAGAAQRQGLIATRLEQAERLGEALRALDRRVFEAQQAMISNPLRLEPAEAVNTRVARLTALAGEHRIRVDEIVPGTPTPGARFTRVPIRLSGAGAYADFVRFLHFASSGAGDMGVVTFDAGCGGPCAPDVQASFSINLVWFAAPSGHAASAARADGADREGP